MLEKRCSSAGFARATDLWGEAARSEPPASDERRPGSPRGRSPLARTIGEAPLRDDFARVAQEYGARLYVVAFRLLGNRTDAEDAVQRALLKCFAARESYSARWAISTWLYRVLTNVCIDEMRRRRSRAAAMQASSEIGPHHAGAGTAGERVDVERALERVPREARVLLALHYVDGLSFGELARVRGISVNTVKSQLARGKAIMRETLESGGRRKPRR
jgi:RNA polymerase sigma-70 factor (ECF subfamily)